MMGMHLEKKKEQAMQLLTLAIFYGITQCFQEEQDYRACRDDARSASLASGIRD